MYTLTLWGVIIIVGVPPQLRGGAIRIKWVSGCIKIKLKIPSEGFYIHFVHCVFCVCFSKYRATLWGYFTHKFVGFDLVGVFALWA